VAAVVVLETPVIASIVSPLITLVITAITLAVFTPVVMVVATIVVASVVVAIVAMIIMSIPIVVAMIGPTIMVITSIRSMVTVVEALATVPVVIAVPLDLLGVGRYSKGTLQLLTLPHGVFGVAVELALVVHDHVEVSFKEGGRSWWICHVGLTRSLA
jgi:hypothetical protein